MTVPEHIRQRVEARIDECLAIAEKAYGREFKTPYVDYKLRGRCAGLAHLTQNRISLNHLFLMNQTDLFIHRTVAHEVAHMICYAMYPDIHHRGYGRKASPHGYEWKVIMDILGAPVSRCHNYDISVIRAQGRDRATYTYRCTLCEREYMIGDKRHARMQVEPHALRCRCSRYSKLLWVNKPEPVSAATSVVAPTTQVFTKEQQALRIYTNHRNYQMADVINKIAKELAITKANARYYYTKFQKKGY